MKSLVGDKLVRAPPAVVDLDSTNQNPVRCFDNGTITCRFRRTLTLPTGLDYKPDLLTDLYLVTAAGQTQPNGMPNFHFDRRKITQLSAVSKNALWRPWVYVIHFIKSEQIFDHEEHYHLHVGILPELNLCRGFIWRHERHMDTLYTNTSFTFSLGEAATGL